MNTANVQDLSSLNTSIIDMYLIPFDNWPSQLPDETDFELNKLNFTWKVTEYKDDYMEI